MLVLLVITAPVGATSHFALSFNEQTADQVVVGADPVDLYVDVSGHSADNTMEVTINAGGTPVSNFLLLSGEFPDDPGTLSPEHLSSVGFDPDLMRVDPEDAGFEAGQTMPVTIVVELDDGSIESTTKEIEVVGADDVDVEAIPGIFILITFILAGGAIGMASRTFTFAFLGAFLMLLFFTTQTRVGFLETMTFTLSMLLGVGAAAIITRIVLSEGGD